MSFDDCSVGTGVFRQVPYMGVIYVVAEAMKLGFTNGDPDWCNLGQGQPEVGPMAGAPERLQQLTLAPEDHAYGPIGGTPELRQVIADHYNRLYRRGKSSQYTADHVCVASGGRLVLSRIFAALGEVNVGYLVPDYTAYEDMLQYHQHRFTPMPLHTTPERGFTLSADALETGVEELGLSAFVFSNPCNPTGCVVQGEELRRFVEVAQQRHCAMIFDEFYSHFIYTPDGVPAPGPVSAAEYVNDVDREPALIIDGLTKNYRYPGWRIGWVLGPPGLIENVGRAASAIDGGPCRPMQRLAMEALHPERADQETHALRQVFAAKRNLMVNALREMGIRPAQDSESTFYVWATIADLPEPFNNAEVFFRRALERKVMTVPGVFFDVNPGGRRKGESRLSQWMRFSFGPPHDNVAMGLERLQQMLRGD